MTRGTLYLILSDKFIASTEFNGSMYPGEDGCGDIAFNLFDIVKNEEDFKKMVLNFNSLVHKYDDEVIDTVQYNDSVDFLLHGINFSEFSLA